VESSAALHLTLTLRHPRT